MIKKRNRQSAKKVEPANLPSPPLTSTTPPPMSHSSYPAMSSSMPVSGPTTRLQQNPSGLSPKSGAKPVAQRQNSLDFAKTAPRSNLSAGIKSGFGAVASSSLAQQLAQSPATGLNMSRSNSPGINMGGRVDSMLSSSPRSQPMPIPSSVGSAGMVPMGRGGSAFTPPNYREGSPLAISHMAGRLNSAQQLPSSLPSNWANNRGTTSMQIQRKRQRVEQDFGDYGDGDDGVPFTTFPTSPGLSFMTSQSHAGYPNFTEGTTPSIFGPPVAQQEMPMVSSPPSSDDQAALLPGTEDLLYQLQNLLSIQGQQGPMMTQTPPPMERETTPAPTTEMIYSQLQQLIELQRMQVRVEG